MPVPLMCRTRLGHLQAGWPASGYARRWPAGQEIGLLLPICPVSMAER